MKTFLKSLLFCVQLFALFSCGSPRSTVRVVNKADSVTTSVTSNVGKGGSTSVTVTPSISVDSTKVL